MPGPLRIDADSPIWASLKKHIDGEIEAARLVIETPRADPIATEHQRGRIAAFRSILALAQPRHAEILAASADSYET